MEIIRHHYNTPNVGRAERAASVAIGAALLSYGIRKKGIVGGAAGFLSLAFLRRGITGFCYTYQALGVRTSESGQGRNISVPYELGIRVDQAVTINRPREEVYRFWRNLENLSQFMERIECVRVLEDGKRSHWIVKGPGDRTVQWDAEVINDVENELIGWRSLPGSEVQNAGSVSFRDAAGGRGTEVRVELQYNPPGGAVGALFAKLFGEEPSQQIHSDLKRLKTRLEAGVVPSTEGQPAGASQPEAAREKQRDSEKVVNASQESFPASDSPAYSH
ncbi:MAG TPA: SRPBCC family protein [Bryobacteraceae bacterium]|nr:SRPBCC family protein [Bryobacteraceae bacterium]